MPDVILVAMPFGPVFAPSIGLSLLKADLAEQGIPSKIEYFTIPFAETIGQALYGHIANGDRPALTDLAGEWIFSGALFGDAAASDSPYVEEILFKRCEGPTGEEEPYSQATVDGVLRVRAQVPAFLDRCVDVVLRHQPKVVGFTSSFQQHVSSLALARRLKQRCRSLVIVFGGANCEGVMGAETLRQFPFIDAVVSGEGDLIVPDLVRRVLASESIDGLQGVRTRTRVEAEFAAGVFPNAPIVRDMDRLPFPDYSDYFERFRASRYNRDWLPRVFIETSRGCWWGERAHCTFCGLNGSSMLFRSKSPERALEEVVSLVRQYPGCDLHAAENILDMRYFRDFLPALRTHARGVSLFVETKSNLKKAHVRVLRESGARDIQPGIESFSDAVLKIMKKGVTGLQNIQLLKWCKELGVKPWWNMLWGFPGEPPEEYARMADLVPFLTHLPAPTAYADIRLDRFSPLFVDPEKHGLTAVTPLRAYAHVYRLAPAAVKNLAYYFDHQYAEPRDVQRYAQPLADALNDWQRLAERSDLFAVDTGTHLFIWDLRPLVTTRMTVLTGTERVLYLACDAVSDVWQLAQAAAAAGTPMTEAAIEKTLAPLVERGLLLRDGSRYLALAASLADYAPASPTVRGFRRLLAQFGERTHDGWIVPLPPRARRPTRRRRRTRRARPLRTLMASQFSMDGRGRLVIRAAGAGGQRERRA